MENCRHRQLELRSICLHRAIAGRIVEEPAILESVKVDILNLISKHGESSKYFLMWLDILNGPTDTVLAKLVEDSEEMAALRQSSPFAGILTAKERWEIYETFRT